MFTFTIKSIVVNLCHLKVEIKNFTVIIGINSAIFLNSILILQP